ncbi:MAG: hypothetical protein MASP_01455 [Candidatus Methanolliviera sp. GoM_asphalt]|nr:MAG: hypothetical protein MASP_01455 [Candidatus Methanolliviera sp. GoM_asphalt]
MEIFISEIRYTDDEMFFREYLKTSEKRQSIL